VFRSWAFIAVALFTLSGAHGFAQSAPSYQVAASSLDRAIAEKHGAILDKLLADVFVWTAWLPGGFAPPPPKP
jgi:hypothetical protein